MVVTPGAVALTGRLHVLTTARDTETRRRAAVERAGADASSAVREQTPDEAGVGAQVNDVRISMRPVATRWRRRARQMRVLRRRAARVPAAPRLAVVIGEQNARLQVRRHDR